MSYANEKDERLSLEQTPTLEHMPTIERTPTFVNIAHVTSAGDIERTASRISRRTSALEEPQERLTRHRTPSTRRAARTDIDKDDLLSLAKSASRISGHHEAYRDAQHDPFRILRPTAAKAGAFNTIKEVPSGFNTPLHSRGPSPTRGLLSISRPPSPQSPSLSDAENQPIYDLDDSDDTSTTSTPHPSSAANGRIHSLRGGTILALVCGAQLMDNIFMTSVNIALPAIRSEFSVSSSNLQWLISAYTLTFGGFLLLSGVLADRYGRRTIFCVGMAFLSVWTIANGFAASFIQMAIFRALQGIGAALTVPSSVGIISSYFSPRDRTRGLSLFGAAGAVGFCLGLILGGILTSLLSWRWIFYLSSILTIAIGVLAFFVLPHDVRTGGAKPKLDLLGVLLSTSGLILLSFVLSSGGVYGWSAAFIIALLILSVALLVVFTFLEKRVSNPIMPLSLWKLPNFAALWISGFVVYGGYQTTIYYTVLVAQEIEGLSASATAVRFLPMGATGFVISLSMGKAVAMFKVKHLLLVGMVLSSLAPVSAAMMTSDSTGFWLHVFPTTLLSVAGVTVVYGTITVVALQSVPDNVKSLCGGMLNTAFQIGSGVGLALSTTVVQAVDVKKGHGELKQYETGLWSVVGLGVIGLVASALGVKGVDKSGRGRPQMVGLH